MVVLEQEELEKEKRIIVVEFTDLEMRGLMDALLLALYVAMNERQKKKFDLLDYLQKKIFNALSLSSQAYLRNEEWEQKWKELQETLAQMEES